MDEVSWVSSLKLASYFNESFIGKTENLKDMTNISKQSIASL